MSAQNQISKLFALILSLALLVSVIPLTVFAEEPSEPTEETATEEASEATDESDEETTTESTEVATEEATKATTEAPSEYHPEPTIEAAATLAAPTDIMPLADNNGGDGYTFDPVNGVLTVTGEGKAYQWQIDGIIDGDDIKSVIIKGSAITINAQAFFECAALESVIIEEGVTNIASLGAFQGCTSLKSVTFPESLTYIGQNAFSRCISLESITIPANVAELEMNAFANCSRLDHITFEGATPPTFNVYGVFYNIPPTATIVFPESAREDYRDRFANELLKKPSEPLSLVVIPGDTEASLSWQAPSSGVRPIEKYEVSNDGGSTWITATGMSHTFTGLTNGASYTFAVRAVNIAGNGAEASATQPPAKPPVTFTVQGSGIDLASPTDLELTADDPGLLAGYTFEGVSFVNDTLGTGPSMMLTGKHGVTYLNGTVTVPKALFGQHQGAKPLTAGAYRAVITFKKGTDFTYEVGFMMTGSSGGSGGGQQPKPPKPPEPEPAPEPSSPAPPSRSDDGHDHDSDSGSGYKPPVADNWLDPDEARSLAVNAKRQKLDYARTYRADRYGVKGKAWAELNGFKFYHDTMREGTVQLRTYFNNPALFRSDARVSGFVTGPDTERIRSLFENWYSNQIRTIHFDQPGMWEQPIKVAAMLDLAGMDMKRLVLYAYDPKQNIYRKLGAPAYWIDANGYLRFTTEYAGEILIAEGELEKR